MEKMSKARAKSSGQYIHEHIEDSLKVLKEFMVLFPELPETLGVQDFYEHLFAAIILHDFGKATDWQDNPQSWNYRHEIISGTFSSCLNIIEPYKKAIVLAICGHHRNLRDINKLYGTHGIAGKEGRERFEKKLQELSKYWSYLQYIVDMSKEWEISCFGSKKGMFRPLDKMNELTDPFTYCIREYYKNYCDENFDPLITGMYGTTLKGLLLACDHLASGGNLILPRMSKTVKDSKRLLEKRTLQEKAGEIKGNLLLSAPTGSGKTEASLLWAENNLNNTKSNRIFYILPFTVSINAMYYRLCEIYEKKNIGMLHGKANYFIYRDLLEQGYDEEKSRLSAKDIQQLTKQIFFPIKVITPYQLLKTFFAFPGYEQSLAEFMEGIFIVDEIHAYEPRTTALIINMLKYIKKNCKGKIMIMTATMPGFLKRLLQNELEINEKHVLSLADAELKKIKRHKVKILEGKWVQYIEKIKENLAQGRRVIVTCNTVNQAIKAYTKLTGYASSSVLLHGRMNTRHREKNEKIIDHVQLLVSTQVVEVSLDIDFDVLFTEPAPLDSLLQRFGRINRRGKKLGEIYIFSMNSSRTIYNENRIELTLKALEDKEWLSEDMIKDLLDFVYGSDFNNEEKEEYEDAYKGFNYNIRFLVPHIYDEKTHEKFDNLFNSFRVVPRNLKEEYIELVKNKKYLEAAALEVSIYKWNYDILKKMKKIKEEKVKERNYKFYVVDIDYSDIFGLVL